MQLKRQIEKNVNIADNHYSAYCLKLRKMRHGEIVKAGTSSNQQSNLDGEDVGSGSVVVSSEATTASVVNSDEEEESTAECIDEPAKVVNVNVGMEFITMLDDMFGRKDMIYPNNVQPSLTISVSVLNELNASWMESLMYQLENESKQMQEIIKQDEEFARELALKKKNYSSQEWSQQCQISRRSWIWIWLSSLLISTGRHDILEQENGVNKFVMEKEMQRQKKILELEKE
ncbi:uncharacterized protein LOC119193049, partial [Manduca sexta]|uniref:uncharacterized protein LOC119193049 n=1 Tax=Manduca sexta TaxID=7130 RepID=UPI00188E897A